MKKNQDIEKVDLLVARYLQNDSHALEEIIKHFDVYFKKYVSILKGKEGDLRNKDTYRFYSLFVPFQKKSLSNIKSVRSMLAVVTREMDDVEIYNELVCIFIGKVLKKYRPIHDPKYKKGVNFLNYMTQIFRFRVKDWCNDLLVHQIPIDDEAIDETQFRCYDKQEDIEKMDLGWITNPVSEAFKGLTQYERYLLYMTYVLNMNSVQIGKNLNRSRDAICLNLNTAKSKLRSLLNEPASSGSGENG